MFALVLLAAVEDWLKFVLPLVFFVIYAINQLLTASKAKPGQQRGNPTPRRKPEAERPMRPAQPPKPEAPATGQAQLNAEIEQFLKRANQRRAEKPRPQQPAQKPQVKAPPRPSREVPIDVEPVSGRDDVSKSVEKHLGNRGFTQRAEHLADDIVRADQQMEDHMQKAFGHRVGTLGAAGLQPSAPATDATPAAEPNRSSAAAEIMALLSNPQTLKQVIVLNEILERPERRW